MLDSTVASRMVVASFTGPCCAWTIGVIEAVDTAAGRPELVARVPTAVPTPATTSAVDRVAAVRSVR